MPVLVVGAESPAGHAAVRSLRASGGEVRAYADADAAGDDEAAALRSLGAKVAVGDLEDEAHLEAALTRVHTVVHLARGPLARFSEHLDAVATSASAALGAGCQRFVLVSEVAASEPAGNAYLEAVAAAEALVLDSPLEAVVLRCGLRYGRGDPVAGLIADVPLPPSAADARHAPLFVDDLGAAVAAADAARGGSVPADVVVDVVGPDELALRELATQLRASRGQSGGRARSDAHGRSGGRGRSPVPDTLSDVLVDWLSRSGVGGPAALGRAGTPVAAALEAGGD